MPLLNACTFEEQQVLNKIPKQVNAQSVECFVDDTDTLRFEDVLGNKSFKKFNGPEIGYGHLRRNLWVKLVLQNNTNQTQEVILSTDQIILEKVDFYKKKEGKWNKEEAGWGTAIQNRELPSYLHAFKVSLSPNSRDTVFYRVRNQYQVVRLPLNLFSTQQFYQHYHSYLFYDGLVTMALITAILYCLYNLFYTSQRDRKTLVLYLIYAVNFFIFYTIRISSPAYFTNNQPVIINYFVNIFVFISTYTFVRFGTSFIDPDRKYGNRAISKLIDILFVCTVFVSLFPTWSAIKPLLYLKLSFFLSTIFYLIWSLISNFRRSFLTRIYFFMAMPLITTGMIEGLTNVFGIMEVPNQFFEAFRISICVEMLYILFALIFRERYLSKQIQKRLLKAELEMLESRIEIQENEQKRIARDLHDDLGGTLASLKHIVLSKMVNLLNSEDAKQIKELTQKSGDDLRRISHALMPPDFEKIGLIDSIKELIRGNNSKKIRFEFLENTKDLELEVKASLNIYRILSEIIQNIHKHSGATIVLVQFIQNDKELTLIVEDNGRGFENSTSLTGLGMQNMLSRAKNLDASLNFDSNSNGTTVILEVPYE
ncbi:7TM-DISM domain-containing protein [Lacihabitans sp. CCS-44]|uniref:sensor histidine kinase n=1 Tax=Lacihabitans sp. CCS-44 TaxID=2487331 RepID=UPI0020CCDCBB|nr:7TM-DISM domain-containing protein [Lacihabitans sp. CCS-44]